MASQPQASSPRPHSPLNVHLFFSPVLSYQNLNRHCDVLVTPYTCLPVSSSEQGTVFSLGCPFLILFSLTQWHVPALNNYNFFYRFPRLWSSLSNLPLQGQVSFSKLRMKLFTPCWNYLPESMAWKAVLALGSTYPYSFWFPCCLCAPIGLDHPVPHIRSHDTLSLCLCCWASSHPPVHSGWGTKRNKQVYRQWQ